MYLIVNEERRIVAASPELLRKAEVESVFDLLTKEDILQFAEESNLPEINLGKQTYQSEGEVLSSLFGSLTILRLEEKVGEEISFPKEEVFTPESGLTEEPSLEFTQPVSEEAEEISESTLQKSVKPEESTIAEEKTVSDKLMENEAIPSLKEEGEPEDILPLLLAEEMKEKSSEAESSSDETEPTEILSSEPVSQEIETQELDLLEANQLEVPEAPSIEEFDEEKPQDKSADDEDLLRIFDEELARENAEEKKSEDFSFEEHLKEEEFEILQKEAPELSESEGITEEPSVSNEKISEEMSTFSLPIEESTAPEKSTSLLEETSPRKEFLEHYTPNAEKNAEKLGLSLEEYLELLSSFVQESHALEESLLSPKTSSSEEALNTLYDAIALLHLDELHEVLDEIRTTPPEQRSSIVEAFYHWLDTSLDRIRETATITQAPLEEEESPQESETSTPEVVTHEIETPEVAPQTVPEPAIEETVTEEEVAKGTPELPENELFEDLQPVPIEFSVKIAAEELNLPEDLVLEFINDFATQGHEYLPVLIESYQNNDLDKLQKTAHMLKGAASNLRIEPMVENLYELQFDTDISRAPDRIRLFAGQLMSLDKYLQYMQNK
ncbi:Hpt domain-containing protein [Nitratifractor sp.]